MGERLRMSSRERMVAWAGLAALVVAAVVVLLVLENGETLKDDELGYAARLSPLGHGYFTPPVGKYIIPVPLFLFRGLLAVAGLRSYLPYELVGIGFVALNACLFFVLAQRRIGALALAPTAILLFFGAAFEVVAAGTLRITELMAVAAGLGMLICLESFEHRRLLADMAAGVLLLAALFCHPLALAFAAAALVLIARREGADRWRALLVVLAPIVIWAIAWLALRPAGQPPTAAWTTVPRFVVESAAAVGAAITGGTRLGELAGTDAVQWAIGAVVVIAAAAIGARRWRRGWRPSPLFWAILAGLLVLWVIEAKAPGGDRHPQSPRYMYPGGVLMLLGLCELAAGIRLRAEGIVAFVTASLVALVLSVDGLRVGADIWVQFSDYLRAEEASIELARDHVDPALRPESPTAQPRIPYSGFGISAGAYLEIADLWGSPAYTAPELARRPAPVRNTADRLLGRALDLHLVPAARGSRAAGSGCVRAEPSRGFRPSSTLVPQGGALLRASKDGTAVHLRRFGPTGAYPLGELTRAAPASVAIPPDSAPEPWRVVVRGGGPVAVCPLSAG